MAIVKPIPEGVPSLLPTVPAPEEGKKHPLATVYPKLEGRISKAVEAGFSDEDIRASIGRRIKKARDAGFSIQKINERLGAIEEPTALGRRFTEAGREGALSSIIGKMKTGEISEFIPEGRAERVIFGGAKIVLDLPIYTIGGRIGGAPGTFALPAGLEEVVDQQIRGEEGFWNRLGGVAKETVKGAALGQVLKYTNIIRGPVKRFIAEVGVLTGVGSALEGKVPTVDEAIDAAILVGGLKTFNAGIRLASDIGGTPSSEIRADVARSAKSRGVSQERALADKIKDTIGDGVKELVDNDGRVNADKLETGQEKQGRIRESKRIETVRRKVVETEEAEAIAAERVRIEEIPPPTVEEFMHPVTQEPVVVKKVVIPERKVAEPKQQKGVPSKITKPVSEEVTPQVKSPVKTIIEATPPSTRPEVVELRERILQRRIDKELEATEGIEVERVEDAPVKPPLPTISDVTPELRKVVAKARREPTSLTAEDRQLMRDFGGVEESIKLIDNELPPEAQQQISKTGVDTRDVGISVVEEATYPEPLDFGVGLGLSVTKLYDAITKISKSRNLSESIKAQGNILKTISDRYLKGKGFDADITFSTGRLHKLSGLKSPRHKFDVKPQESGVKKADITEGIPLPNSSVDSVVFDPPFMVASKQQIARMAGKEKTARFSGFDTVKEAQRVWRAGVHEAARISRGPIVVKIQDTISQKAPFRNKRLPATKWMMDYASEVGMSLVDSYSNTRPLFGFPGRETRVNYLVFDKPSQTVDFGVGLGQPFNRLADRVAPLVDSTISRTRIFKSDVDKFMRQKLRVPFWNKDIAPITDALHRRLERSPREDIFIAEDLFRQYRKLPKTSREKIGKVREIGDREGRAFTVEELKARGLNEAEITGYQNVRAIYDYYHNVVLKREYSDFRRRTISDATVASSEKMTVKEYKKLSEHKRSEIKEQLINKEANDFLRKHFIEGYEPRYRFGRFVGVVSRAKDDVVIHREAFDTPEAAQEAINSFSNTGKNTRVIDTKNEFNEYKELMAIANYLPGIEKILKTSGTSDAEIGKAIELITQQYAMGRLAKRKGVEGFSKDLDRSLETYIQNFPTSMAKRFNADVFSKMIRKVPEGDKLYARDLVDYFYGRKWKEGSLNRFARTAMYSYYLALKPAFGVLNYTQRMSMTAPWTIFQVREFSKLKGIDVGTIAASAEGWRRIGEAQVKGMRVESDLVTGMVRGETLGQTIKKANYLTADEKTVLSRLYRQGELREMRQLEITGGKKFLKYLDIFGFMSERSNRIHAALTGTKLYSDNGLSGRALVEATDRFINTTQIMYSKANRPEMSRGALAPVTMFKSYMLNYLNMAVKLYKNDKGALANMVGVMLALGGVSATPFFTEELTNTVDAIMNKIVGDDWSIVKRRIAAKIDDNRAGKVAVHGLPSLIGVDAGAMVGFPDVVSSAVVPLIRGSIQAIQNINRSDMTPWEKYKVLMPRQMNKMYTFYKLVKYGTLTDKFGKPYLTRKDVQGLPREIREAGLEIYEKLPKDWSFMTKMEILLGFPTMATNSYYKDVFALREAAGRIRDKRAMWHREYAQAMFREDDNAMDAVIKKFEKEGIAFDPQSILGHLVEFNERKE